MYRYHITFHLVPRRREQGVPRQGRLSEPVLRQVHPGGQVRVRRDDSPVPDGPGVRRRDGQRLAVRSHGLQTPRGFPGRGLHRPGLQDAAGERLLLQGKARLALFFHPLSRSLTSGTPRGVPWVFNRCEREALVAEALSFSAAGARSRSSSEEKRSRR